MGPPMPQETGPEIHEGELLRAARRSRVRAQAMVAQPDAKPARGRSTDLSLSRLRCPSRYGEESLLLAIRRHREAGQPTSPLARQRSCVPLGGRFLERTSSGSTNAATIGSERGLRKVRTSSRIALRGAKRTKRSVSGGSGRGRGRPREIPRMPSFGRAAARPGRARDDFGDLATSGGSGGGTARSNAVNTGNPTPSVERRGSSTPTQMTSDVGTWQGLVETVGASVFDSVSTATIDPTPPRSFQTTGTFALAAGGEASTGTLPSSESEGEYAPKASETVAASLRSFVAAPPATKHAVSAGKGVTPTTNDGPSSGTALPNGQAPNYGGIGGYMRNEAVLPEGAVGAIAADVNAATVAVIAERTKLPEGPERKPKGGPKFLEEDREVDRTIAKKLVPTPPQGLIPVPEGARVGEDDFSGGSAEREMGKIVTVGGKPLLATGEGNSEWAGVSVEFVAKGFEQEQQRISSERADLTSSSLAPKHLVEAAIKGMPAPDNEHPEQNLPDAVPSCPTPSGEKSLDTDFSRPGGYHGRKHSDGRAPKHRDRAILISQTSINSLVRDAMELADAIEQGWTGDQGDHWRWKPGQQHQDLSTAGAGERSALPEQRRQQEQAEEQEREQVPMAQSLPAGAGAGIGAGVAVPVQSAATVGTTADVFDQTISRNLSSPADRLEPSQGAVFATELVAETTAAQLVYHQQQKLRKQQLQQQERQRHWEQKQHERLKKRQQRRDRRDGRNGMATDSTTAEDGASQPGCSTPPAPPPPALPDSTKLTPLEDADEVPAPQASPAATEAGVASSRVDSLTSFGAELTSLASTPSLGHQTSVMTLTADSPDFESSRSGGGGDGESNVYRTRQARAAGQAAVRMENTSRFCASASGGSRPSRNGEGAQDGDAEMHSCSRPHPGAGEGAGKGPPPSTLPLRESQLKPALRLVHATTNGQASSPLLRTANTPSSDLGLVRRLTSRTSPSSSLSPAGLLSAEVAPVVAAATASRLPSSAQAWSATGMREPKPLETSISSEESDICPQQSSTGTTSTAMMSWSATGTPASAAPALIALKTSSTSVSTAFHSSNRSSSSSSSSSSTRCSADTRGGTNNSSSKSCSSGGDGGGRDGSDSLSRINPEAPAAEDWTRYREKEQHAHGGPREKSPAMTGSDGGGCFPFLARHGDREDVAHSDDTDSDAGDNLWFACSGTFFSKSTRRSANSLSTFGTADRGGSDRSNCPGSPRSRLREAALEAVARQFVAAGGRAGGGSLDNPCRVALRCEGSGVALSSRIRNFLASERKVFLLTGEAGSGKSLFVATLAHELALSYSHPRAEGRVAGGAATVARAGGARGGAAAGRARGFLPVILDARASEGEHGIPLDRIVEHYLTTQVGLDDIQVSAVQRQQRLLVIVDGFDRIPADKRRNLWTSNSWAKWKMKAVITSRPFGLEGIMPAIPPATSHSTPAAGAGAASACHRSARSDTEGFFVPTDRRGLQRWWALETATIAPLAADQVESFLRRNNCGRITGRSSNATTAATNVQGLAALPALGSHPLTLSLVCQLATADGSTKANAITRTVPPASHRGNLEEEEEVQGGVVENAFRRVGQKLVASPPPAWKTCRPERRTRTWLMSHWLEEAMRRTDHAVGPRAATRKGVGIEGMGRREGDAAAGSISITPGGGVGTFEAGGRFSSCGVRAAEDLAFSLFQVGRWTGDAGPSVARNPAPSPNRRLQHVVALRECGTKLWGFSKSSLLEFLVASRVKRGVLEEGVRRQMAVCGGVRSSQEHDREKKKEALPEPISIMAELNISPASPVGGDDGDGRWASVAHPGAGLVLSFLGEMCSTDPTFAELLLQLVNDSKQEHRVRSASDESSVDKNDDQKFVASTSNKTLGGEGGGGRHIGGDEDTAAAPAAVRNHTLAVAAANAMTVLCRSGYSFAGMDLSRIKIPGAVLDGGIFDGCSFDAADLAGCSLKDASLRRCNLRHARMSGVDFGVLPVLRPFRGGEETIGRVEVSADGSVAAVLSGDGRHGKLLRTGSLREICFLSPGAGRVFSLDLLLLSPDGRLILSHTVPVGDRADSKRLELRRVGKVTGDGGKKSGRRGDRDEEQELCARVIFDESGAAGATRPCFFPDTSRFVHQHGESEIAVVDCVTGESVDVIRVNLGSSQPGQRRQGRQEEWPQRRRHDDHGTSTQRRTSPLVYPSICSVRVTPDQSKVQVGLGDDDGVVLEYDLGADGRPVKGWLSAGCEASNFGRRCRRVIDGPTDGRRGLLAVLGPDRAIQINSWRVKQSLPAGGNEGVDSRIQEGRALMVEKELARLRCGDEEKIEEVAFASSGEFFLTRDSESGTASLWSVRPTVTLVKRIENVCCRMTSELFVGSGKVVALGHSDCTVKVYSCETGRVLLSHSVPSLAFSVAITAAGDTNGPASKSVCIGGGGGTRDNLFSGNVLHAFTKSGQIHRWHLPPGISVATGFVNGGGDLGAFVDRADLNSGGDSTAGTQTSPPSSDGEGSCGVVRAVAALPASPRFSRGTGGIAGEQDLVLVAGDRGLVAVDAARGVLVRDFFGIGGDGRRGSRGDGCSGDGGGRGVSHIAVTPDGKAFFSVGEDNVLVEWDARTYTKRSSHPLGSEARSLAVSQNSKLVAVLTFEGVVVLNVDAAVGSGGEPLRQGRTGCAREGLPGSGSSLLPLPRLVGRRDDPVQVAFWDDGVLAIANSRGRVQLWDVAMYRQHCSNGTGPPASLSSLTSSVVTAEWGAHDGPVTSMAARPAAVQTPRALQETGSTRSGQRGRRGAAAGIAEGIGAPTRLQLSRSLPALATGGGGDGMVRVWTEDGFGTDVAAVVGGTRHYLRRGGSDSSRSLCSPTGTENSAVASRGGHEGAVLCVCWHPGGELLASAGQDWAIWLWNAEGRALSYVHAQHRRVSALCFSDSGGFLMSCSAGGGLAGWVAKVSDREQVFTARWKHPKRLVATDVELEEVVGLSDDNAHALCDHGAAISPLPKATSPPTDISSAATRIPGTAGGGSLETTDDVVTPMSFISTAFHGRVEDADWTVDGVRSLARPTAGNDLEARDTEGMTLLLLAARCGRGNMVEALLMAGAHAGASDDRGYTAVCWAAAGGFSAVLRSLLFSRKDKSPEQAQAGAADRSTNEGDTPAILAARGGHLCALAVLEQAGADLDKSNPKGETPLIAASRAGRTQVVAFLTGVAGTDLERDPVEKAGALTAAASLGHAGCVRVLLARGADPFAVAPDGQAPVFHAASGGHLATLRLLLEAAAPDSRAEAMRPDLAGRTPVMAASASGHLGCLRVLIDGGGGCGCGGCGDVVGDGGISEQTAAAAAAAAAEAVETTDNEGRTALMHACIFDQAECVKYLLSIGARLDDSDHCEITPIMLAAREGNESCLSILLGTAVAAAGKGPASSFFPYSSKADLLDVTDANGSNACHHACRAGESGALGLLADAGACLEVPSASVPVNAAGECVESGMYPVHLAVAHGSLSCLEQLAARGVNLEATDGNGETPLSLAIKCDSEACGKFLACAGVVPAARASSGAAGMDMSAKSRVNINRPAGPMQERPLNSAARRGRTRIVYLLLAAGANPAATDCNGETAVHAAARRGHAEVIGALAHASGRRNGEYDGSDAARKSAGVGPLPPWWLATTDTGETATFAAAVEGHAEVLRALRATGAMEPSRSNAEGVAPMVAAALGGHSEVIRVLLDGGGDINETGGASKTPAMAAAMTGDRSLLEFLVSEGGADLWVRNADGRTAAYFAAMNGHVTSLALILGDAGNSNSSGGDKGGRKGEGEGELASGGCTNNTLPAAAFAGADAEDNMGCTPLWTAAANGHVDTVKYLVGRCSASPNARGAMRTTATWMAAGGGYTRCLVVLLDSGADGNLANEDGLTPALIAAKRGHAGCLRVLAEAGVDLTVRDLRGNSAAAYAAMGGHLNCLKVLAGTGSNLDVPNAEGHSPAFTAITHGQPECLRVLTVAGADLARRDLAAGNTPAMIAARRGCTECLLYLVARSGCQLLSERNHDGLSAACLAVLCGKDETLSAIAEIDPGLLLDPDPKGRTAVHRAAAEGTLGCLEVMAKACVKSEPVSDRATACCSEDNGRLRHPFEACLDEEGESPLHVATRAGHLEVFAYLVNEAGLRPEAANARGENCLWLAAAAGRVDILRLLVEAGLDVNTPDQRGCSPAHAAAREGQVDAIAILVEAGRLRPPTTSNLSGDGGGGRRRTLDLDARDVNGASPLHHAVAARRSEAVTFLCDAGAEVDAVDAVGNTPCWQALVDGQAGMLELLASKGADLNVRSTAGTTLTHVAARDSKYSCLEVLCEQGADVDVANQLGTTPIMFAAMAGDVNSVNLLAYLGCDLSKRDSKMITPVFFSAENGHTECLSLLLSLGADASVKRADGATPLMIAAQNGHESCVKLLINPPPVRILLPRPPSTASKRSPRGDGAPLSPVQQHHAGLEACTASGYTALSLAVAARKESCARELLVAGADVEAADRQGRSPLYLAAAVGSADMCGLLLEHGALPRRRAADGLEPAMVATTHGHASAARRVLEDALLDPAKVLDAAGESISAHLARLGQPRHSSRAAEGDGGKGHTHKAAILPASVALLTPDSKCSDTVGCAVTPASYEGTAGGGGSGSGGRNSVTGCSLTRTSDSSPSSGGNTSRHAKEKGILPLVEPPGAPIGAAGNACPPSYHASSEGSAGAVPASLALSADLGETLPASCSGFGGKERDVEPVLTKHQRRRPVPSGAETHNEDEVLAPSAQPQHRQARPAKDTHRRKRPDGETSDTLLARMAAFLFDSTVTEQASKRRPSSSSEELASRRMAAVAFARGASKGKQSAK